MGNYCRLTTPLRRQKISLRTINRVSIPHSDEGRLQLEDYFNNGPALPSLPDRALSLTGFLNQHRISDRVSGQNAQVTFQSRGVENGNYVFLLDIVVFDANVSEDLGWQEVESTLALLRGLKNDLFRASLTEKCLNLFTFQH